MAHPSLIDEESRLDEVLEAVEGWGQVAVDTEFLWERTYYPKLALLQVAGRDEDEKVQAFAVDPLEVELQPLLDLLREPDRLKIFHAGRIDLQIFHRLLDAPLEPVFDTQCAAALTGFGPQIGYANLVQAVMGRKLKKAEQYTDWTRRPLRTSQIEYALDDVVPMLEVFEALTRLLEEAGRSDWAEEEMAPLTDPESYVEDAPTDLYQKVKGRRVLDARGLGALRELAAWRDSEARRRDLRPGFIVKDPSLVEIASRRPKSSKKLREVRGLHKNEAKRSWDAIRACLERAEQLSADELPRHTRGRRKSREDVGGAVDLLRAFLNKRAVEVGVAAETLATTSELERLARDKQRETYEKDHPVLCGWRRELVGQGMLRILRGEVSLGVDPKSSELKLMSESPEDDSAS